MPAESVPFKVADLSLADFGRREIRLAEHEMPGLMAVRADFADSQPLAGARITGSGIAIVRRLSCCRRRQRPWRQCCQFRAG